MHANQAFSLHSISRRAPWAVFSVAPLLLLSVAYLAALAILWSGWQMFLPQSPTPFVRIHGIAVAYFAAGRYLYYWSPLLIGWATAWLAARWKISAQWPVVAFALLSITSVAVKVSAAPGRLGKNVGLGFAASPFATAEGWLITAAVFAAMTVPYMACNARRRRTA